FRASFPQLRARLLHICNRSSASFRRVTNHHNLLKGVINHHTDSYCHPYTQISHLLDYAKMEGLTIAFLVVLGTVAANMMLAVYTDRQYCDKKDEKHGHTPQKEHND
ncbi:unnamed protein product, partial [Meganyctiphanes norvegica]